MDDYYVEKNLDRLFEKTNELKERIISLEEQVTALKNKKGFLSNASDNLVKGTHLMLDNIVNGTRKTTAAIRTGIVGAHACLLIYDPILGQKRVDHNLAQRVISDLTTLGVWVSYAYAAHKGIPLYAIPVATNAIGGVLSLGAYAIFQGIELDSAYNG
jgi:hypothetical protein